MEGVTEADKVPCPPQPVYQSPLTELTQPHLHLPQPVVSTTCCICCSYNIIQLTLISTAGTTAAEERTRVSCCNSTGLRRLALV